MHNYHQNPISNLLKHRNSPLKRMFTPLRRWGKYRLNLASCSTILLAASIVAVLILSGYAYCNTVKPDFFNSILYGTKIVFQVLEGDSVEFREAFPNHPIATFTLCVAVPFLTVITVVAFLLNFFPKPLPKREAYFVFAEADEQSILLAENLFQDSRKNKVCLLFLRSPEDGLPLDHANRLKAIHAQVYPYTESELLEIHYLLKKKVLRFFFLSSDTDINFARIQKLIEEAESKDLFSIPRKIFPHRKERQSEQIRQDEEASCYRQELYLLSETSSAPMLIDHLRLKLCDDSKPHTRKPVFAHTDLRLLDRYRTVTYHLLKEKPLYETAQDQAIRVLVLGFGHMGQEFFRAAASFCPMAGYNTTFCLCDLDIETQWQHLIMQYPECAHGLNVQRESLDAESGALLDLVNKKIDFAQPFTYIVLSLGDDERNIKAASTLNRFYCRLFWDDETTLQPAICVNLEDAVKSKYVPFFFERDTPSSVANSLPPSPLFVFGSDHETFSSKILIDRNVWTAARQLHAMLKSDDFVYWPEYERRSSIACVSHAPYHVKAMESLKPTISYNAAYDAITTDQRSTMIDAEHRRWMQYSRCEGMQAVSTATSQRYKNKIGSHADTVAQLTPCLVNTEDLPELYRTLYPSADSQTGNSLSQLTFIERDTLVVKNAGQLCQILEGGSAELLDPETNQQVHILC